MPLADWGKNYLLDVAVGGGQAKVADWYVALLTAEPTPATTGSGLTEPAGGSYARIAVPNDGNEWGPASSGLIANLNVLAFPIPTADWGLVRWFALTTASSGGNLLGWALLTPPRTVGTGQSPKFTVGSLTVGV